MKRAPVAAGVEPGKRIAADVVPARPAAPVAGSAYTRTTDSYRQVGTLRTTQPSPRSRDGGGCVRRLGCSPGWSRRRGGCRRAPPQPGSRLGGARGPSLRRARPRRTPAAPRTNERSMRFSGRGRDLRVLRKTAPAEGWLQGQGYNLQLSGPAPASREAGVGRKPQFFLGSRAAPRREPETGRRRLWAKGLLDFKRRPC